MELITPVKDSAAFLCKLLGLKIVWKCKRSKRDKIRRWQRGWFSSNALKTHEKSTVTSTLWHVENEEKYECTRKINSRHRCLHVLPAYFLLACKSRKRWAFQQAAWHHWTLTKKQWRGWEYSWAIECFPNMDKKNRKENNRGSGSWREGEKEEREGKREGKKE